MAIQFARVMPVNRRLAVAMATNQLVTMTRVKRLKLKFQV